MESRRVKLSILELDASHVNDIGTLKAKKGKTRKLFVLYCYENIKSSTTTAKCLLSARSRNEICIVNFCHKWREKYAGIAPYGSAY